MGLGWNGSLDHAHAIAIGAGDVGGAIRASIADHDDVDLAQERAGQNAIEAASEDRFLVVGRDHHGDWHDRVGHLWNGRPSDPETGSRVPQGQRNVRLEVPPVVSREVGVEEQYLEAVVELQKGF